MADTDTMASGAGALAAVQKGVLSEPLKGGFTVGELERALLARFPAEDAEPWDRTGLLVGDASVVVAGVAVALDPTASAVRQAKASGANVLLTHHPAFIDPPERMVAGNGQWGAGTAVFEAAASGVALMNFHTTLDADAAAQAILPDMLSLDPVRFLAPLENKPEKGYGMLCRPRASDAPMALRTLAARCTAVFGRVPRVWGDPNALLHAVATSPGAAGGFLGFCVQGGIDCLVCGEVHYHDALAASDAGLAIVELGHDVSELPFCMVLAAALRDAGLDEGAIKILDQTGNWWTPEATRK